MLLKQGVRALRFNLSRRNAAAAADWESFKMPGDVYAGMGPLPPPPAENSVEGCSRFTFVPETFFKLAESKLGYTGGYTLLWGSIAFMVSKEYLVMCPEIMWTVGTAGLFSAMWNNFLGPAFDRESYIHVVSNEDRINTWKSYKMDIAASEIDGVARLKEQTTGLGLIQQQRKNNLALALEAEYLNRQADLAAAVKKRLDYQVALTNAEREAQSKHMINWIEREVNEAISKRKPQDDLKSAITALKGMAKA